MELSERLIDFLKWYLQGDSEKPESIDELVDRYIMLQKEPSLNN